MADANRPATLADRFANIWDSATIPPDLVAFLAAHPQATSLDRLDVLLIDQRRRVVAGMPRPAEDYLKACPDVGADPSLKLELVYQEQRGVGPPGKPADPDSYATRFPDLRESLSRQSRVDEQVRSLQRSIASTRASRPGAGRIHQVIRHDDRAA